MIEINKSNIINEYTVCPYCMSQVSIDDLGCCGESSCHFEIAYETKDGLFLSSEIEILNNNT